MLHNRLLFSVLVLLVLVWLFLCRIIVVVFLVRLFSALPLPVSMGLRLAIHSDSSGIPSLFPSFFPGLVSGS